MKKIFALVLALMLVLAGLSAFAADSVTYKITLDNTGAETEHKFEIYQIFTGDLSVEGTSKTLSNVKWGEGQTAHTVGTDATADAEAITTVDEAKAFAKTISASLSTTKKTVTIAAGATGEVTGLVPGYYLVKDETNSQTGDYGSYTAFMLLVVGDATQSTKTDAPEVEKKVADDLTDADIAKIVDGTYTGTVTWQDSADYDIGDHVPYEITAKMGAKIGEYEKYKITITDELSNGLTYDNNAKVFVGGTDVTPAFSITFDTNTKTLTIHSDDVKAAPVSAIANTEIVVKYSATLNTDAVVGVAGNPNTVKMTYSNNPNDEGEGENGKTPTDTVIVFTFDVKVNKVEADEVLTQAEYEALDDDAKAGFVKVGDKWMKTKALEGAAFKLEKDGKVIKTYTVQAGQTQFDFKGLDAGTYTLTETVTPKGFNTIDPITFVIEAEHDVSSDEPKLTKLVVKDASGNVIEDFVIKMDATTKQPTGEIETDVLNEKGSTLPETGGIGTTIFYIAGSILVLAAVVLLVTKRRMNAEK